MRDREKCGDEKGRTGKYAGRRRSQSVGHLDGLLRGGVGVELEDDAGLVREAYERDARLVGGDRQAADERDDERLHQVPVGVVGRRVGARLVDDAAGRVQHERDVGTRVTTRCNATTTQMHRSRIRIL